MNVPLRRTDKEIKDPAQQRGLLERAQMIFLAMCRQEQPYVVPLNFAYHQGAIFIHTGQQGLKMDYLAANGRVCFALALGGEILPAEEPCDWSTRYQSLVGFGRARLVEEPEEKSRALATILRRYGGQAEEFPTAKLSRTAVIRIEIDSLTAKQSG